MISPTEAGKILREYFATIIPEQFLEDVKKYSPEILEGTEFEEGPAAESKPLVFIAYTHADESLAQRLGAQLQQDNFRIGLREQGETGDKRSSLPWDSGIERADAVVVLLAPRKAESKLLRPYVDLALSHGRRVLLLASDESQVPSPLHHLDQVRYGESDDAGYQRVREALL